MERRAVSDRGVVWMGQPRGLPVRDAGTRARALPRRPGARADARPCVPPADDPARSGAGPGADRAVACDVCRPWPGADVVARGLAGGLVFLAAPPAGIFCALWVVTIAIVERRWAIWRAALAWVAATSVWLVPLAIAYHRYHGFVPIAHLRLTEPNATQTLVAVRHLVAARAGRPRPARPVTSADGHPRDRAGRDPRDRRAAGREHLAALDAGRTRCPDAAGAMAALPAVPRARAVRTRRRRGERSRDGALTTSAAGGHRRGRAGDRRGRRLDGPGVCDGLARARPHRGWYVPSCRSTPAHASRCSAKSRLRTISG